MFKIGKIYTTNTFVWFGQGHHNFPKDDVKISPSDNILLIKIEECQTNIYMIWYYFLFDSKIIFRPNVNTNKKWFKEIC